MKHFRKETPECRLTPRNWFIGKPCPYCGTLMTKRGERKPTKDHAHIPKSKGGRLTISNRVICCQRCNWDKKHHPLIEWHRRLTLGADPRASLVAKVLAQIDESSVLQTLTVYEDNSGPRPG